MNRPTIISFGEVLWDLFPDGPRFGGAPANFACHAAALGGEVSMVSAVGDDLHGHEAVAVLESYGIRTDLIQHKAATPTGTVGIGFDEAGKPNFTIHESSAWDQLAWNSELEARVGNAAAVYFGTLGQRSKLSRETIRRALALAAKAGRPRVLDVNLRAPFQDDALIRDSVGMASILKLSDDELADVCGSFDITPTQPPAECLNRLRELGELDLVVMTCGAEGAILVSREETMSQPAVATKVRDTVGAGDAFTAALLIGLLRGDSHDTVLTNANKIAAEVCSQTGAVPFKALKSLS
jgi:fructokinase